MGRLFLFFWTEKIFKKNTHECLRKVAKKRNFKADSYLIQRVFPPSGPSCCKVSLIRLLLLSLIRLLSMTWISPCSWTALALKKSTDPQLHRLHRLRRLHRRQLRGRAAQRTIHRTLLQARPFSTCGGSATGMVLDRK